MNKRRPSRPEDEYDEKGRSIPSLDGHHERDLFTRKSHSKGQGPESFKWLPALISLATIGGLIVAMYYLWEASIGNCNDYRKGYWCHKKFSHKWGQYSPFFDVRKTDVMKDDYELEKPLNMQFPPGCSLGMVAMLSRHGARGPTAHKNELYNDTIAKIKYQMHGHGEFGYKDEYRFLRHYKYDLVPDELNKFGKEQLQDSGRFFFYRYGDVNYFSIPLIRASEQQRVYDSAERWRSGFVDGAKVTNAFSHNGWFMSHPKDPEEDEIPIYTIPECSECNNTLHHSRCTAHETGRFSRLAEDIQTNFTRTYFQDTVNRLNTDLRTDIVTRLNETDVINLMQLCAFDTLDKRPKTQSSPFCRLFEEKEFVLLDYYETLDKWYSYSHGNELGPTQGVGWVNELLARLTDSPVHDHTSTNRTLDTDPRTFPLPANGVHIFADFTHDNDLTAAVSALGYYNHSNVDKGWPGNIVQTGGFSSAWVCPFAARVYVEKLICPTNHDTFEFRKRDQVPILNTHVGEDGRVHPDMDQYVRVIINNRVMPPVACRSREYSQYGLCHLQDFVDSQTFAQQGGKWDQCFEPENVEPPSPLEPRDVEKVWSSS